MTNGTLDVAVGDPSAQTGHRHERYRILIDLPFSWFLLAFLPAIFILPSGRAGFDDPVVAILAQFDAAETRGCRFFLLGVELFGVGAAVAEGGAHVVT